jgi:hypothetical protein
MTSSHASRWHRILLFLFVYSIIVRDNHTRGCQCRQILTHFQARCKPHGFRCRGARPGTFTRSVAIGDRCREPILSDDAVRATPTLGPRRGVRRKRLCAVVVGRCRHLGLFDALLGISEWPSSLRFGERADRGSGWDRPRRKRWISTARPRHPPRQAAVCPAGGSPSSST